jgi:hypothetical protein
VSQTLAYGLRADAAQAGLTIINAGQLGCGIEVGTPYRYFGDTHDPLASCPGWDQRWAADLARYRPAVTVVEVGRWEIMDRFVDGRWTRVGDKAYDQRLLRELDHAVDVLSKGGRPVVFATPPYSMRGPRPDGGIWPEDEAWRVDDFIALLHKSAAAHPGVVTIADITATLFPDGHWQRRVNGVLLQSDGVHLTVDGVRKTEPVLLPLLERITGEPVTPVKPVTPVQRQNR